VSSHCAQGDVFWYRPDGANEVEHRVVICSDPHLAPDSVVAIPFTTWEEHKDDSCFVTPLDYQELPHDSCIDYRHAEIFNAADLDAALAAKRIRQCPAVSTDLLEKILDGARETRFLNSRCLNILTAQGLLDA